jgi:hypothetical protein
MTVAAKYAQVERVAQSATLRSSESLCHLLRFLASHAIEQPGLALKESRIATEVFGRPKEFDPRLDSTVRVQTSRLRVKLLEYYAGPGAEDSILIEIPKGSYSALFRASARMETAAPVEPQPVVAAKSAPAGFSLSCILFSTILGVLLGAGGYALFRPAASAVRPAVPAAIEAFWKEYTEDPEVPLAVFSGPEHQGPYTGAGGALAIHEIDSVFARLNRRLLVKSWQLLDPNELERRDLILIGPPEEALAPRGLRDSKGFVLRIMEPAHARKGELGIVNLKPLDGEQSVYLPSPQLPRMEDYALIEYVPGKSQGQTILLLAGTTAAGTQAAVEYVCHNENLEELLSDLHVSQSHGMSAFAAVIHVKLSGGVPIATKLVTLRQLGR